MLITVQLPMADVRSFVPEPTARMDRPEWPLPSMEHRPFVRGFGPARRRRGGGVSGWTGEAYYCDLSSSVRFHTPLPRHVGHIKPREGMVPGVRDTLQVSCAFRRLYADGHGAARIELGFGARRKPFADPFSAEGLLQAVTDLLGFQVTIPWSPPEPAEKRSEPATILGARSRLAQAFLAASTKRTVPESANLKPWWVSAGMPAILVQLKPRESQEIPPSFRALRWVGTMPLDRFARTVTVWRAADAGADDDMDGRYEEQTQTVPPVDVFAGYHSVAGIDIPVWIVRSAWVDYANRPVERDLARRARVHILRLHAEIENAKTVLHLIRAQRLAVGPSRSKLDASALLQFYLQDVIDLLLSKRRAGIQQDVIFEALGPERVIPAEERQELLASFADMRASVKTSLERLLESPLGHVVFEGPAFFDSQLEEGSVNYKKQVTNVGAGATVGNIVQADSINDSFKTVQSSSANDEIKSALGDLAENVKRLIKDGNLDEPTAKKVAKYYDALASEATSPTPDKAWYSVSAQGLKDAATAVIELVPLIGAGVDKIVRLIGGGG